MRPLSGRVLLKRPPISEKIGSIIIPDKFRMIPQEGEVVAVSKGQPCPQCGHAQKPVVQVGQQVLHGRYSRMSVPGPEEYYLVWERDLMAILEP